MQSVISRLGAFYLREAAAVPSPAELGLFRAWLTEQWRLLPVQIKVENRDVTLAEAVKSYYQRQVLIISSANNCHPHFTWLENIQFRAVHDWHHILTGADDSLLGEMAAYRHASGTAPQAIWWILRSEIVLQAAAFYHTGSYQPQKLVRTA